MINNESDKEKFNQIYHKYKNLVFYVAYHNIYSRKIKNLIGKIALDRTIDFIRKQKLQIKLKEKR